MSTLDFIKLDRDLAATAQRWRVFRRGLRDGSVPEVDPFETTRWVSTLETFRSLESLPSDLVTQQARRWVYRMTEQRVNREALLAVEHARRHALHVFDEPEHNRLTLDQILKRALADDAHRAGWLRTLTSEGLELSEAELLLWQRRQEVARRMGVDSPATIETCTPGLDVQAEHWLERTQSMWEAFRKPRLSEYLTLVLGKKAYLGWPVHLSLTSLTEWFRGSHLFTSLRLEPGSFPRAMGASSFQRAMARLGGAWVDAAAPTDQPFVISHDPYGLKRRTYGALLGLLLSQPDFLRRMLGLGRRDVKRHRQVLGITLLGHSRLQALRWLLRPMALEGPRLLGKHIEDLSYRVLGFPLKISDFGTLVRLNIDDAQRFSGLFLGHHLLEHLVRTHDEDFYRNPRAIDEIRSEISKPPLPEADSAALQAAMSSFESELVNALE